MSRVAVCAGCDRQKAMHAWDRCSTCYKRARLDGTLEAVKAAGRARLEAARVIECTGCGQARRLYARGRCSPCYERARRDERREGPRQLDQDFLLHEVEFFLNWAGLQPEDLPGRLGMRRESFDRALLRGRDAGDPRADLYFARLARVQGRRAA